MWTWNITSIHLSLIVKVLFICTVEKCKALNGNVKMSVLKDDEIENGSSLPPPDDFKMPSLEEMLKALDALQGISDEEKEELKLSLEQRAELGGSGETFENFQEKSANISLEVIILFAWLSVMALIFVFFGYKLYKSLVEKERRRDEKKRQKQQKKKK